MLARSLQSQILCYQELNCGDVWFRPLQLSELLHRNPSDLVMIATGYWFRGNDRLKAGQIDHGVGYTSRFTMEQSDRMGGDSEFLGKFSAESVLGALCGLDFSTRELPHSGS